MDRDAKSEWYAFFASEGGRLRRYVRARAQRLSRMDAEDVVSEVMLSMLSRAEKTGPVENLAAYAYRSI
ncbi:MAG: hypothetical protein LLF87_10315 [Eubacteriales bacterium]|nr:hypothetical protein [Eubacteriales bacterium]